MPKTGLSNDCQEYLFVFAFFVDENTVKPVLRGYSREGQKLAA